MASISKLAPLFLLLALAGVVVAVFSAYVTGTRAAANGGPGFRIFLGAQIPDMPQRTLLLIGMYGGGLLALLGGLVAFISYRNLRG